MLFTYNFGEKLDTTKFQKQFAHYVGQMREVRYHIYLPNYKIVAEISAMDNSNAHIITMYLSEIQRDLDREIIKEEVIFPLSDARFQENKDIQSIFSIPNNICGTFVSNNTFESASKLCRIIKLIHKINSLKAFL